jgi:hypothetical protein
MKILFKLNQYNQQRQTQKPRWIYPVLLAMYATYLRDKGNIVVWDREDDGSYGSVLSSESQIDVPFLSLPHADRLLTRAMDKKWQNNGNFKYLGTYLQAANGCWHGQCSFCVEKGKPYEVREVDDVVLEIDKCSAMGFEEVFDDSGTFPQGQWLHDFCCKMVKRKMVLGCNFRLMDDDFYLMKQAGFRMLLIGLESASQRTLDKLNKGIDISIAPYILERMAKAGLEAHTAWMFSIPGETPEQEEKTLKLIHYLLKKGLCRTAQASIYKVPNVEPRVSDMPSRIYEVAKSPEFIGRQIGFVKNMADFRYLVKAVKIGWRERCCS